MRGLLEVVITDEINDRIKTQTIRDTEGYVTQMSLLLRTEVYEALKERRTFELHEGFRHVCLRESTKLDFLDQANYQQLKAWESQQSD